MKNVLTPKQVARALGVSESSVKRWCDQGAVPTQYTRGGHRRIALASVVEMVRQGKWQLVQPEALGLPPTSGTTGRVLERALQQMTEALLAGSCSALRRAW